MGVRTGTSLLGKGLTPDCLLCHAGSIAGDGTYTIGNRYLIVGGDNLSTEVSGTIQGSNVLEKDGKLHCLIEWVFLYPLEEESENVYRFPADYGLYHGEKLRFTRDGSGKAVKVEAARVALRVMYSRRSTGLAKM